MRGSGTVLVVEDHEGVRSLIVGTLELCGFQVLQAGDGLEALRQVAQHAGNDRSAADRRDHARHEREGGGRSTGSLAAGPEGAVHVGVQRRSDRAPRRAGCGRCVPTQAVYPRHAERQGAGDARRRRRRIGAKGLKAELPGKQPPGDACPTCCVARSGSRRSFWRLRSCHRRSSRRVPCV